MPRRNHHLKAMCLGVIGLSLSAPVLALAFFEPTRVLLPQLADLYCPEPTLCVDDPARIDEARRLYSQAIEHVQSRLGPIADPPRGIFCATGACSDHFGLRRGYWGGAAAYNVGTAGFVISYRGWTPWFVRHELIHHLQNERLGSLNAWWFKPDWFKEGMAYAASEDPRALPEPLAGWRQRYRQWRADRPLDELWQTAEAL